jgi:hypothetical protein
VLLSPIYAAFGLDLYAMKVANILVFAVFLLVFYRYSERRIVSRTSQLVLLAMVAFSPWFWNAKDSILPDFAFLLFLYSTIQFVDRRYNEKNNSISSFVTGLTTGLLAYLVYGIRSVGMFLIPALILFDLVRHRKVRKSSMIAIMVFLAGYLAQNLWLQTDASYIESIQSFAGDDLEVASPGAMDVSGSDHAGTFQCGRACLMVKGLASHIPGKTYYYTQELNSYWENGFNVTAGRAIFVGVGILSLIGFIHQMRRTSSLSECFVVVYVTVLLVVPFIQARYLLPLLPAYLLYAVSGIERIVVALQGMNITAPWIPRFMLAAFLCIVMPSYAGKYLTYSPEAIVRGVESTESRELFAFVRTTPQDSLFVFHKPRPLALFTGRRSVIYYWASDVIRHWEYLTGIGATHIIVPKYIPVSRYLMDMVDHYRDDLEIDFENRDFVVYRIAE